MASLRAQTDTGGQGAAARRAPSAWHDASRNALVADMSASGQFLVVLGAFDTVDSYQVGDDSNEDATSPTASAWFHFDRDGTLPGNSDLVASDIELAFQKKVTIAPGATAQLAFYLTLRTHLDAALAASDQARSALPGNRR